ncbi:sugar phosphate isomerase/epimerase family protein [Granulosicoccus sp. 3-233]|uniref:sugar phosphate isomerase/epimerase family protein n=1 Tax=Granulosicoccus sp. 3-233 TaxID=3417969 RepID=UPI003D343640
MNNESPVIPALCSVTFRSLAPEELIPLASQNGVRAIEWGADVHVPLGDLSRAEQVAELCRQHEIDADSYGSYVRAGDAETSEEFAQALASAKSLGANNIRVWAGRNTPDKLDDTQRQKIVTDLAAMAEEAASQDITVSIEFHRNTMTERLADTVQLLENADHVNLFTYWQPVPGRAQEELLAEITTLAPWLGHVHVFHWLPAEGADERRPLMEGRDSWSSLMSNWKTSPRWSKPRLAMLEFVANNDEEQFKQDMRVLRQLCTAC